ncbi:unnamed protein product [Moneuplotes crassus]|uniref:Uncharacterized protein n=1 Tax=Euplotes crassus TaxID=5936 RepID=A0AAD1Y3V4_EUPCR|nr:unnamed protein product [Moneuplotes crassus]
MKSNFLWNQSNKSSTVNIKKEDFSELSSNAEEEICTDSLDFVVGIQAPKIEVKPKVKDPAKTRMDILQIDQAISTNLDQQRDIDSENSGQPMTISSYRKTFEKPMFKTTSSKRTHRPREDCQPSMFEFRNTTSTNRQNLVMNMTRKGLVEFMKQYNTVFNKTSKKKAKTRSTTRQLNPSVLSPQNLCSDLPPNFQEKYTTNFQVRQIQTTENKRKGFFRIKKRPSVEINEYVQRRKKSLSREIRRKKILSGTKGTKVKSEQNQPDIFEMMQYKKLKVNEMLYDVPKVLQSDQFRDTARMAKKKKKVEEKRQPVTLPPESSKPVSSHSTIRYYDEQDTKNDSQLMAKRFRSTSILRNYNKICSKTTSKNITKTLLGLQRQKIAVKQMRSQFDDKYFNNIRLCKTNRNRRSDLTKILDDSKFTVGISNASISTKKTDGILDAPKTALQRNMTNYPANKWLRKHNSKNELQEDSCMMQQSKESSTINPEDIGLKAFLDKNKSPDKFKFMTIYRMQRAEEGTSQVQNKRKRVMKKKSESIFDNK